jgi:predicted DsbA family dithiol-disulfide isomerase
LSSRISVVEYTDPACSWAWGTEPKLRLLRWRYDDRLDWRLVLGGLIGDMNKRVENFDPVRMGPSQSRYWKGAYQHTGMTYPVKLEWMPWSTEPAGKAVKAAELQSSEIGERVLRRMRESIFIYGRPADTPERILDEVRGVAELDEDTFAADFAGEIAEKAFREDWEETRRPNAYVMNLEGDWPGIGNMKESEGHRRYAFPTIIFKGPDGEATVPGWCAYEEYEQAMETAAKGSTANPRSDPTPDEVFARWPTATQKELDTLCGGRAPEGVVAYDWGEGTFYMTPAEAEARGI